MNQDAKPEERAAVWQMFDRIAGRYDLLNRLLSGGIDQRWRRRAARRLPAGRQALRVLDVATGTGDQLLVLARCRPRLAEGVGVDMAEAMLQRGRRKIASSPWSDRLSLQTGDATDLPFGDGRFDAVTISFGIRNVMHVDKALSEMLRVLCPGGRAVVLEFSLPERRPVRALYLFYLRHLLPRFGHVLSGDGGAYRYLNRTIEAFPCGEAFCALMRSAGFVDVACRPLTGGIASIYTGERPQEDTP